MLPNDTREVYRTESKGSTKRHREHTHVWVCGEASSEGVQALGCSTLVCRYCTQQVVFSGMRVAVAAHLSPFMVRDDDSGGKKDEDGNAGSWGHGVMGD